MAKKEKVTVNGIDKILQQFNSEEYEINFGDIVVKVKPSISLKDYSQMITDITLMVFDLDRGSYKQSYNTFAIDYNIIKYFTNITTSNVSKIFDLVTRTDILEKIAVFIRPSREIIAKDAVNAIDYVKNTIFKTSPWDEVANKVSEVLDSIEKTSSQFGDVKAEDVAKVIDLFGSINKDDIKEIALKRKANNGQN